MADPGHIASVDQPVRLERSAVAGWGEALLVGLGAGPRPARQTIEHLLAAEDAGHPSHGLRMLVSIAAAAAQGRLDPAAEPVIQRTSGTISRIDGRRALGPPTGLLATHEAVAVARVHGTSAVAVRRAGHMGRLAPFAEVAAAAGCALFICANDGGANQHVVPAGGTAGRLSTNPIAFGVPRARAPHLVVDMATSAYAHGTLGALAEAGRAIPDDALHPDDGDLLAPMAGHKGFALGLMIEALAGALTGAGTVRADPPPDSQGALLVAIDVAAARALDAATRDLEDAIDWVRSASAPGAPPIRIPGEHRADGAGTQVTIAPPVWASLGELSRRLGVRPPEPEDKVQPC
jgi:hydroxycarboxylate dehydrogenase B